MTCLRKVNYRLLAVTGKSIDDLPADIYKLLDGADLSEAIEKFKDDIGSMLVGRFKEYSEERQPSLRMSNIGKPLRQLWYELKGYKGEELSSEAKFKFLYGHLIETLVLFLAEASGHKVERLQEEVEVDGVLGHIDAVVDGVLIDVKSCSSRSFEKFQSGSLFEDDPFGYIGQLSGYAHALGLEAGYLAVDKVLGKICLLKLPKEQIEWNDPRARIKVVREALDKNDPPTRCYQPVAHQKSGNMKLGVGCSYCAYKSECWKDSNGGQGLRLVPYANGPVWLTHVEKEPRLKFNDNNNSEEITINE